MVNKQAEADEDYEELMNDEEADDDEEELDEEELTTLPPAPRKLSPDAVKKMKEIQRSQHASMPAENRPRGRPRLTNTPTLTKPSELDSDDTEERLVKSPVKVTQTTSAKRYTVMAQPERIALGYADTGEIIAEPQSMPLWAAQMWADLKNDIEQLRTAIGGL